jgi:Cys-tRNA(Pro) deacylase
LRSCSDVHNFLLEAGVAHEMLQLPGFARTALQAARLLGVPTSEVVKSLLFLLDGAPTLVLVPGDAEADLDRLCAAAGCRKAVLARGQEVLETTGYRVGAVPPCGLAGEFPVIADPTVFAPPVVYCGGGATTTMLKIRSDDLRELAKPQLAQIAERAPASRRAR